MKRRVTAVLALAAMSLVAGFAGAAPAPRRVPKLVVILVVDQMRADYVEQYGNNWTGGLRRLMTEGAWFREVAYPYMTTVTCAGHSTIVTGSLPRTHGITGNSWWDRENGRLLPCVSDADKTLISYGAPARGGTSTKNLLVPTLPDELRAQTAVAPRIVTASMKDYTATTMAGRRADAAVWFNLTAHAFTTSTAFTSEPVPFVASFVKSHPIDAYFGKSWNKLLPESAYLYADDGLAEQPIGNATNKFPHFLRGVTNVPDAAFYAAWEESPFSDEYLGLFAETAIDALRLGQRQSIDYLAVSFSALDAVGHDFGPRSHEVQDVLARLDRTIGSLLAHLDRSVGRRNYVLALTADHGVAPIPEQIVQLGISGGRISTGDLVARVEKALEPLLGPGRKVATVTYNSLYFAPGIFEKLRADPAAMSAALEAVSSTPGIARVFRADELAHLFATPEDPIERAVADNFFPERSGDLIVITHPYYFFSSTTTGTTHGSPWGYDQHVPLFLLGQGIKAGQYLQAASPVDIAPTLAFLSGITLAAAEGRVLNEALLPIPVAAAVQPAKK
jgi:predicted AlkP superfamily pyrophosphatase or phosphodiesterase